MDRIVDLRLVTVAVVVLVALLFASAAQASSCGSRSFKIAPGLNAEYNSFHVYGTSCKNAVKKMRAFNRLGEYDFPVYIDGWKFTHYAHKLMGRNGKRRFWCFLMGTD